MVSFAGQDRRVVGAAVVEDGAKINSLKQQSNIIRICELCWRFYMKYVIVSLVEMKREMNTSDNIEWMRLRVSVCAWDWCGTVVENK